MTDFFPPEFVTLSEADALAFDALIGSGFDAEASASLASLDPRRVRRLAGLLAALEPHADDLGAVHHRLLADVTMTRVLRAGKRAASGLSLSPDDAAAVDALMAARWDPEDAPARHAARARRASGALVGLDDPIAARELDAAARTRLVDATLARVQQQIDRDAALLRFDAIEAGTGGARGFAGFRFGWADLVSVAAMLVLTFGVIWPAAAKMREDGRVASCAGNMQNSAVGFTAYANDHEGSLPVATAGFDGGSGGGSGGSTWWNVGEARSHSADLFTLAREGYLTLRDLTCPGNHSANPSLDAKAHTDWRSPDEVSYSYQLPPTLGTLVWSGPMRSVVITDRSPVVERARRGEAFNPLASSTMHKGRGQNALRSDGSAQFLASPVLPNGDNIWLPRSQEIQPRPSLKGMERPGSPDDAFVGP